MPFEVGMVVGLIGLIIGIGVWFRTKRLGPTFGVLIGAFVIVAIATPSLLTRGGALVGSAIDWISNTIITGF